MRQVKILYEVGGGLDSDPLMMTMMFDFFGELLTDKQREYFDLYHNEDLSLSEIAVMEGISKQGVHDILSRAERKLLELEQKTDVVHRWLSMQSDLGGIERLAEELLEALEDGQLPVPLAYLILCNIRDMRG